MSNPNAVSIFNGRLTADPKFFTNKDGVEFAASFNVAVQRARPDKDGEFQSDYYPCRYSGARRLEVKKLEDGREFVPKIRRIKKSDVVSIIGCFRSEKYEKDGETKYVQYFDVERIGTPTGVYPKKDRISPSRLLRARLLRISRRTRNLSRIQYSLILIWIWMMTILEDSTSNSH